MAFCSKFSLLFLTIYLLPIIDLSGQELGTPSINFAPETYLVERSLSALEIDGELNEDSWNHADWSSPFVDIEGDAKPSPRFQTRVKMLWDDHYFYIAAELEEPDLWATLTERDAVIFQDNNFEVFIDSDGDTHSYYELEVNALETWWDLMLTKPYRNGGKAIDAWDIRDLKVGIHTSGTLNDPADKDQGWIVELAIPWNVLEEASADGRPSNGSQWRVNFSRVQWQRDVVDGVYVKKRDPDTGEMLREDNWSWSPQGLVNMHYPEMWGYVQFSSQPADTNDDLFVWNPAEDYKWLLRQLYYRQADYKNTHGHFTENKQDLDYQDLYKSLFTDSNAPAELTISLLDDHYLMRLSPADSEFTFYIRNDSKSWQIPVRDQ